MLPVAPPIKPMLAKAGADIPDGDGWLHEPKWDGFRTIVFRDRDALHLRSRNDRPMNRYFPEVERTLLDALPDRCVLDGEIILPTDGGLEFETLQLRLHPAASRVDLLAAETPCSFVAFDVLGVGDEDLMAQPLGRRLEALDDLLGGQTTDDPALPATAPGPALYRTARTSDVDVARRWFVDLEDIGCDGLICKRSDQAYLPGDRGWVKVKHRRTADCVVGGYRLHKDRTGIGALLLGLYDDGDLRYVGHTSSFKAAERRELLATLEPMRAERSFSGDWGPGGPSRWSGGRETEWIAVEPKLVCEVSYDFVQSGQRFRHAATFIRWRDDKPPDACTFDQVTR